MDDKIYDSHGLIVTRMRLFDSYIYEFQIYHSRVGFTLKELKELRDILSDEISDIECL